MKKVFFAGLSLLLLAVSCQSLKEEFEPVFTEIYPSAEAYHRYSEAEALAQSGAARVTSIRDLVARYNGASLKINDNLLISGIVSSTDQPGNFYKSFYIQDETGGIEIKIGKNGLYNDYPRGLRVYVSCKGLQLGMYGGKNADVGMVQLGFVDPTGEYETSYIESSLLVDDHIWRGEMEGAVQPAVLGANDLPGSTDTQASNRNVGRLVTIKGLEYGWYDTRYKEDNEVFALLYLSLTSDKKVSSNRLFISDSSAKTHVTTWAMSKTKMTSLLLAGYWDEFYIGNGNDYNYGQVGDWKYKGFPDRKTKLYSYPGVDRQAASVSHYFSTPEKVCVQIRTSGYAKFSDTEINPAILAKEKTIDATGILTMYQGKIQLSLNSLDDIVVNK
ncbi:MAG: hypothetical protein J5871_01430 [Bacteroidales bacterium]|nr:hypothetical protein [Bacteroidales bacterium]